MSILTNALELRDYKEPAMSLTNTPNVPNDARPIYHFIVDESLRPRRSCLAEHLEAKLAPARIDLAFTSDQRVTQGHAIHLNGTTGLTKLDNARDVDRIAMQCVIECEPSTLQRRLANDTGDYTVTVDKEGLVALRWAVWQALTDLDERLNTPNAPAAEDVPRLDRLHRRWKALEDLRIRLGKADPTFRNV